MESWISRSLRLSRHDIFAISAFSVAIGVANLAGDASWPVWVGTLIAPLTLGVWQIRQANVSELAIRDRIQSELASRNRDLCEANIVEALRQAVRIMAGDDQTARANVMLIGDDNKLFIAYHLNMADAPDHGLRFDKYQGCTGHAWALGEQAVADLEGVSEAELKKTWKLLPDQIALTKHVHSMICTPIRHPHNRDAVVGVFSVDSGRSLPEAQFDGDDTTEEGLKVSEAIGRLLIAGGII